MTERDTIFYDGDCGLCHRWMNFVISRDRDGERFVFSPLQGETFTQAMPEAQRAALPDSILVLTADGEWRMQSEAVLHILRRLGGVWAFLASAGRLIPRGLRDWGYGRVASVRHHFFKKPSTACPLMPPELRGRFKM